MLPVDVEPLWVPSPERAAATRMAAFWRRVGAHDYPSLHKWSVDEPDEFWSVLWRESLGRLYSSTAHVKVVPPLLPPASTVDSARRAKKISASRISR